MGGRLAQARRVMSKKMEKASLGNIEDILSRAVEVSFQISISEIRALGH